MARPPTLSFDRGTLLLHPPPPGKAWIDYATWDDRVERFRLPALHYRRLIEAFKAEGTRLVDHAPAFEPLPLVPAVEMMPYPHQRAALAACLAAGHQGVVVLPMGAGKTYLAQLVMQDTQQSTLIVVPTLDLMHQWYAHLLAAFPDAPVGPLGGGSHDRTPLLVATYDSAAIQAEALGNHYALLIFDECHHLPSAFTRVIAEYSLAPYHLGLTATPERRDGTHAELHTLIGPEVHRTSVAALTGTVLAPHRVVRLAVVYRIAWDFLIPAITHHTPVKERHDSLQHFRTGAASCATGRGNGRCSMKWSRRPPVKSRSRADGGKAPASPQIVSATGVRLSCSPTTRMMRSWPHGSNTDRRTTDLTRRVVNPARAR